MFLRTFEHENIIYDSAIFDVPHMIDIAILYGNVFPDVVAKIYESVFSTDSKFVKDAVSGIQCVISVSGLVN